MPLALWEKGLLRNIAGQLSLYFQNLVLMKNLEEKLKELEFNQQFLENIFQFSPIGILVVKETGNVISANPKARDLLSLEHPGQNLFASYPELRRRGQETLMLSARDKTLLATRARIHFSDREVNYLVLLNDISEKLILQEQLKEKEKMALLGQLAATIAHEINTPITGICSYAQMLQPLFRDGTPEGKKFAYIQQESFHVSRVVSALLEFSRSQKRQAEAVPLGNMVRQALRILEPRLAEHGFAVRTSPPAEDPVVLADPILVPQALTNLILNSCEAVGWAGRVELAWSGGAHGGEVTIEDNGPGIAPDLQDRVMEPFVTTKGTAGTGLGLTISRAIIGSLGGTLTLDSAPGKGTRVRIELPYEHPDH
jgi:signal transduction histidine kinase